MTENNDFQKLREFFNRAESNKIEFVGFCHDCNKKVTVKIDWLEDGKLIIEGGAVYFPKVKEEEKPTDFFLKCDKCYKPDSVLRNYQPCQVWSRTVGFYRPVDSYNPGKKQEMKMRKNYKLPEEKMLKVA